MSQTGSILLADDNPNDVELTIAALRASRVRNQVVIVQDGAEALDYLLRRGPFVERAPEEPGLVLLDLKMPRVDGLEVLRHVKDNPHLKTLPVVMLTSSREEQDVARTYALGANAYVVKPVAFDEFMNAVRALAEFWIVINEPPRTVERLADRQSEHSPDR